MDALDNSFYNNSFYNGFLLNNDLFSDVFVPLSDTQSELALYNPENVSPISSPDDYLLQCQANDSMYLPTKAIALADPTCRSLPCAPRKRGRPPLDKTARKCTNCGTNSTPEWRKGPSGPHTLCNACGLHFMKSQRKERHARKKQALKAEADQKMEVNAQGMAVPPKAAPVPPAQEAQAEAEARAYSLAHAQAQAQFQAQQAQAQAEAQAQAQAQIQSQEEANAIEAQNQAQIHAQIQAFLNASDTELQMPSLPSPALCFQENALAHDPRLQAAFASLSAALQLTPDSFHLMSGGGNM